MKDPRISVVEAAAALKLSYNQTLRLILIGVLDGKRVNGRWTVDSGEVERLRQQTPRLRAPMDDRSEI